jgi:hypothetical protein
MIKRAMGASGQLLTSALLPGFSFSVTNLLDG